MNLSRVIEHHSGRYPDRIAVEYEGEVVTYRSLLERIRTTAGALRLAGVDPGDVVGVLVYNCADFIDLMFATAHVGAVFMPLNWRLAGSELAYIVNHAGTKLLVSEFELEPVVGPVLRDLDVTRFVRLGPEQDARWNGLDQLRAAADPIVSAAEVSGGDIHRLMYTSGTTGRPKGVMITYDNVYWKNIAQVLELGIVGDDRGLVTGPLYHVGALDLIATNMLYGGASTYILRKFGTTAVLDAIEGHRITSLWLAPVMLRLLLEEPSIGDRDLNSVRLVIDGGEKMPLPLIEKLLAAFPNAWFADAWGLTETVGGDTFLDKGHTRAKLGSVGKPVLHVDIRVVDDQDRPLPAGEPGEIVVRGPKVCKGYWRDPEATEHAMRGGWLHTGDIGVIDDDGYLFIVDRLKDMIISGGENVASSEVERVVSEHQAVLEVAVVGRPDPDWGEVPVAYVVLARNATVDEEELLTFCRARIAKFKVPKAIRFADELPRNPSGKVLKHELRAREREALAARSEH